MAEKSTDKSDGKPVGAVTFAPEASALPHEDIPMEQWLRLLVVVTTVLLLVLTVGVAVKLLSYIGHTLLIFSLGGLLAYALDPLIERARGPVGPDGRRTSRTRTTLVVFTGIICLFVAVGLALSKPLTRQIETLSREHALYEQHAREKLASTDAWLADHNVKLSLASY